MSTADDFPRTRGRILHTVRRYGPNGISYEGIERIFHRAGWFGSAATLEEHLHYLREKDLVHVERTRDAISGVKRWLVTITAKGIDLLDERIEADPGVDIVR